MTTEISMVGVAEAVDRKEVRRKRVSKQTAEQLSELGRKAVAARDAGLTPEQRSDRMRRVAAARWAKYWRTSS